MPEVNYTPGPWYVNPHYPKGAIHTKDEIINHNRYVESESGTICTTSNRTDDVFLIAAAPLMLEALKAVKAFGSGSATEEGISVSYLVELALKAAEGL